MTQIPLTKAVALLPDVSYRQIYYWLKNGRIRGEIGVGSGNIQMVDVDEVLVAAVMAEVFPLVVSAVEAENLARRLLADPMLQSEVAVSERSESFVTIRRDWLEATRQRLVSQTK